MNYKLSQNRLLIRKPNLKWNQLMKCKLSQSRLKHNLKWKLSPRWKPNPNTPLLRRIKLLSQNKLSQNRLLNLISNLK
jgi:hypothetical protein